MQSEVTIAVPCHCRTRYVRSAIASAARQTYPCKILVSDNASDHSGIERICGEIQKEYGRKIDYVYSNDDLGMVGNWNRCIELSDTHLLTLLHDDDVLHPKQLENCVRHIEQGFDCVAVECLSGSEPPSPWLVPGKILDSYSVTPVHEGTMLWRNLSPAPGVLFRRSLAQEIGGFRPQWYPCADYDFWIRFVRAHRVGLLSANLAFYRIGSHQASREVAAEIVEKSYLLKRGILSHHGKLNWLSDLLVGEALIGLEGFYTSAYGAIGKSKMYKRKRYIAFHNFVKRHHIARILSRAYKRVLSGIGSNGNRHAVFARKHS